MYSVEFYSILYPLNIQVIELLQWKVIIHDLIKSLRNKSNKS
jgi:hypothetical protein